MVGEVCSAFSINKPAELFPSKFNWLAKDVDTYLLFMFLKITISIIIVEHFCVFVRSWGLHMK